jgi:multicomponent Na+:H+ antiporter subunit C
MRSRAGDPDVRKTESAPLAACRESIRMDLLGLYNYWIVIILMMTGFYVVIARPNLVKKIVGLFIFQTSVFLLFISMAKVAGGTAPILEEATVAYSNPLPHVLILTAIVVNVSTMALGLALIARIHEAYGSINEDEIHLQDEDS